MSANANLRGAVFEVLVTHFAESAGYSLCAKEESDEQFYERAGMPMVHGLGEGHNADVLLEPPMTLPMTPETRLLVECKGYAERIGLDVIRNAITVRNDLNAYKRLSRRHLEERKAGRRKLPIRTFPYYHVAVASLHGFSGPAQTLAATYHVELLDYHVLPILGQIPSLVSSLALPSPMPVLPSLTADSVTPTQSAVAAVRAALRNALHRERLEPLDWLLKYEEWSSSRLAKDIRRIWEIASKIRACYSVTLPNGTSIIMLADRMISLDPGAHATFEFGISYSPATMSWALKIHDSKLEFQLPGEFFEAWRDSDFSPRAASAIKREHFYELELFGFVRNESTESTELRHVRGRLDRDALRQTALAWDAASSRKKGSSYRTGEE